VSRWRTLEHVEELTGPDIDHGGDEPAATPPVKRLSR